jgi:hypothetical protein
MLTLTTEAELTALYSGLVKESLHLEYKASDAIDKKSDQRNWRWLGMFRHSPTLTVAKSSTA